MKQEIIPIDLEGVNCYLGKSEEGFVLFDTGGHLIMDKSFTNRREELTGRMEELGIRPGNLKAIILTHGDSDHAANAAFLREKYKSMIAIHRDDLELVNEVTLNKMMESFRYRSVIYKAIFGLLKNKIEAMTQKVLNDFEQFKPDVFLKEGDDLSAYGFSGKVLHLPGHTPGSIGILSEQGELVAGDIFTNVKKPALAPNAADFRRLEESAARLYSMKITRVYPGHGRPFEVSQEGLVKQLR
jgi:glyoxylase-like metal-dependent hydrolase (beta-lactamase superfamily II)